MIVEPDSPLIRKIPDRDRKQFEVSTSKLSDYPIYESDQRWVLNIDLDYFSCSGDPLQCITLRLRVSEQVCCPPKLSSVQPALQAAT